MVEISIAVAAAAFALLVLFLIGFLLSIQKALHKLNCFDPTLKSVENLGRIAERETEKLKKEFEKPKSEEKILNSDVSQDIIVFLALGLNIIRKFYSGDKR